VSDAQCQTNGDLTRGRGLTETQRLVWVLSTPACAEINSAIQELAWVTFTTTKQHKEATSARLASYTSYTQQLLLYLSQKIPFKGMLGFIVDSIYVSFEIRSSNNPLAFLWALIVLL
jgi:hypothetical protein